jgi:rare lipoprotein A (peptidoglycan hydrolase)
VNDKGPFIKKREIDLSERAAKIIGISKDSVKIKILDSYDLQGL